MREEMRRKILDELARHRIMTVATLRPDGWPQATIVGYANDGFLVYFICARDSQKAANLARDARVSIAIGEDTENPMAITGLSMAARVVPVGEVVEIDRAIRLMLERYPEYASMPVDRAGVHVMRATPEVVSVLDYSTEFGHADLVEVGAADLAV